MGKMAAIPDVCERTATVALPTAASGGFTSGDVGISAALDEFSTVYELPLTRFKKGQTDRQTNRRTCTIPNLALRCASREVNIYATQLTPTYSRYTIYPGAKVEDDGSVVEPLR